MTDQRVMRRTRSICASFAGLLMMALMWFNAEGAEPRRVLLLHSFGQEFEPFIIFSENFRSELAQQSPEPLDFFDVALAGARFEASQEAPFVDYLLALFAGHRVDLVVPMGGPACRFAQKYRARLFLDKPMLLAAVDQRMFQSAMLTTNDAVLSVRHDPKFMVEAILRLLPATTNVVVVYGNSSLERFWNGEFIRAIQSITPPVRAESFSELPFTQMKERAATLPPHSVMLYGNVMVDADGVPQTEHALRNLHAVANAPMFGIHDFQLGRGIVGGPLVLVRELSHRSAWAAARILHGEAPANFRPPPLGPGPPTYDWRELRRWGIAERNLPPGSIVQFREKTIWELYRGWILGGISVFVVEGAIIASLLVNRIKRRKAEAALKVSEERYREVVESQTDLVCRFLPDGTLTFANGAYCRFFGYPREEIIGRKFFVFVPEKDRAAAIDHVAALNKERRALTVEHEVILPDGTIGWQHWVDYPILGPDAEVTEFQGIGRDITDRKRVEAANLKLTHAMRLAMTGEFTGMVVHDLSQPLSAIVCNARAAELMLQNSNPPALKEIPGILEDIRRDGQRAGETVLRMRALLRRRQLELKPLDFRELVAEVLSIVSGEAARRRVQIKTELAAQSPPINGDRVHLQQVLLNLILNGMDAMATTPESKRSLLIRTAKKAHEIEVTVSDTGQGIPLERLPHIFDSFFTTKAEGLGLGLSICKWIIGEHRGRITAENDANGGATFRFTLPTA
jgi:PAS domain S-box-containing protein